MYGILDVTSRVPWKACWGKFSIAIYGNVAYVQTDGVTSRILHSIVS